MTTIRAQVTIPVDTALPEDAVTNTLFFRTPSPVVSADLDALDGLLTDFYTSAPTGQGGPIAAYYSPVVNFEDMTFRYYDMADPIPRVPLRITTPNVAATTSSEGLPDEVAVVLSFHANTVSGQPAGRRRGRIYIGPLGANARTSSAPNNRPDAAFLTRLRAAAVDLVDGADAASAPWVVHSETADDDFFVIAGWTDNAFDTQRRRGVAATARNTWAMT